MLKIILSLIIGLSFTNIASAERYFLLFSASWCTPCKTTKARLRTPEFSKLIVRYENYIVDIDQRPDLKTEYQVKTVPMAFIVETYMENNIEKTKLLYKWSPQQGMENLKKALREYAPKEVKERPLLRVLQVPIKILQNLP